MTYINKCKKIFAANPSLPIPTNDQCEKLYELTAHMLEVNKSMNLTAITDEDAVILKHYADSLTVSKYIPEGASVIDIGCGAGFPSLPLAIFRPDLRIVPLDSTAKRIEYVRSTAEILGFGNVHPIVARAEELATKPEYREKFDVAIARAVAALPILCEFCLPYVKLGGSFVAMKAAKGESELEASKKAIELCGGGLEGIDRIELTADKAEFETRYIIDIKKIARTPQKYPRHYSQISKKPL